MSERTEITTMMPCPICGAKAEAWEWNGGARVQCSKWCVKSGAEHMISVGGKTLAEAVAKWNDREGGE